MKNNIFLLLTFVLMNMTTRAQDVIYKTNGTKVNGKVLEINNTTVKYKSNNHVFEENKNEVNYIIYENGIKEFYNTSALNSNTVKELTPNNKPQASTDFEKNIIAINCFDMLFTNFSASYEHIFSSGKVSIKLPLSLGLGGKPNDFNYTSQFGNTQFLQNRIAAAGLELNLYPLGQTKHTFYLGLSSLVGNFHYFKDSLVTVSNNYGGSYTQVAGKKEYTGTHYSGLIHIGGYIRLSENFLLGAKFGIGYKYEETIEPDFTFVRAQLDLNVAYRF